MAFNHILARIVHARVIADFSSHEEVLETLERAAALARGTCFEHLLTEVLFTEAYSLLRRSDRTSGLPLLARALTRARQTRYPYPMRFCSTMPLLCAEALNSGLEVDYVRQVVATYRLRPPSSEVEHWPWPVKIFTLGGFEVQRDGATLDFPRKAPRKPLMLLKALIAFRGQAVPEERLMDALWPDDEADSARRALDINVLRLRRLLGSNDAVLVSEEQIGLNPELCWVDVWAFERKTAEAAENDETTRLERRAEALTLYRGNFLPGDIGLPWTLKTRERLKANFVRVVESIAGEEEARGHWDRADGFYLPGLEADDLIEAFHLGLMRCYRALGRPAEAIAAFRRLRQTLSVVLGIAPSSAAEALAKELIESHASRRGADSGDSLHPSV
jgi:DNA-binding SARP family transcriptional activator